MCEPRYGDKTDLMYNFLRIKLSNKRVSNDGHDFLPAFKNNPVHTHKPPEGMFLRLTQADVTGINRQSVYMSHFQQNYFKSFLTDFTMTFRGQVHEINAVK